MSRRPAFTETEPVYRGVDVRCQVRTRCVGGAGQRSYDQRGVRRKGSQAVGDNVTQPPRHPVPHDGVADRLTHHEPRLHFSVRRVGQRVHDKPAATRFPTATQDGAEFLAAA